MMREDRGRRDVGPERSHGVAADRSSPEDIARFIATTAVAARRTAGARLIFALDATMSRQPTWDRAVELQAGMFEEATRSGGLEVQLVYFRGGNECRASRFVAESDRLAALMRRISCRAGSTEIGRVLTHAAAETSERTVAALVFVGDAVEEEPAVLYDLAGRVALVGVPCFMFQEGHDDRVARVFAEIARLTRGAHVPFDEGSAGRLGALLRAASAFATGGRAALDALADRPDGEGARLLIGRMSD